MLRVNGRYPWYCPDDVRVLFRCRRHKPAMRHKVSEYHSALSCAATPNISRAISRGASAACSTKANRSSAAHMGSKSMAVSRVSTWKGGKMMSKLNSSPRTGNKSKASATIYKRKSGARRGAAGVGEGGRKRHAARCQRLHQQCPKRQKQAHDERSVAQCNDKQRAVLLRVQHAVEQQGAKCCRIHQHCQRRSQRQCVPQALPQGCVALLRVFLHAHGQPEQRFLEYQPPHVHTQPAQPAQCGQAGGLRQGWGSACGIFSPPDLFSFFIFWRSGVAEYVAYHEPMRYQKGRDTEIEHQRI